MQNTSPQTLGGFFPVEGPSLGPGNKLGRNNSGNPTHNLVLECGQMLILSILGLSMGIGVDLMFGNILRLNTFDKAPNRRFAMAILQLFTLIIITFCFYSLATSIGAESVVATIQGSYPGMLFGIFFFGTQNNMFAGLKGRFGNVMG